MTTTPYIFLTTKPQRRLISKDHPELLVIAAGEAITSPTLKVVVTFTDATTESFDLIASGSLTLRAGESHCFNVGYDQYNYDAYNTSKTVKSFIIRVESADFTDQAAQDYIEYYPRKFESDTLKSLYYSNSQGGIDSLICTGDQTEANEQTGIITAQPIESVYDQATAQFKYTDPRIRKNISTNTGFKPGKEIFALQDLFKSEKVYEYTSVTGGIQRVPVIMQGEGVTLPSERSNLKQLQISYKYAFEDKVIDRIL